MTRDAMIEKLARVQTFCDGRAARARRDEEPHEYERASEIGDLVTAVLAALAAPVAAEPPSLVALVQEWQAAERAPSPGDGSAAAWDAGRRLSKAKSALLAWAPAQAEPAAPLTPAPEGFQWIKRSEVNAAGNFDTGWYLYPLPASSPAAPEDCCPQCGGGNDRPCSCQSVRP